MNEEALQEMGPVDYLVVEWPDQQPTGEAAPLLIDLVDRGLIRILDLAFIVKGEDGSVAALEIEKASEQVEALKDLIGASSGLISDEDVEAAGEALDPGTSAAADDLREQLGRTVRGGGAPHRRPARRQRPHPDPVPRRGAGRRRVQRLTRPKGEVMPGLLRGVARTAVIAGTATTVSNRVSRRQGQRWAQQEPQQAYAEPAPAAAPAADPIEQLKELGELHKSGVLTDEEFAAQKAKLLG